MKNTLTYEVRFVMVPANPKNTREILMPSQPKPVPGRCLGDLK